MINKVTREFELDTVDGEAQAKQIINELLSGWGFNNYERDRIKKYTDSRCVELNMNEKMEGIE